MSMNDPISDYLTRIRNAHMANKQFVDIPCSNLKIRISYILKEEHFIRDYIKILDNKQNVLRLFLRYDNDGKPVIHGLERVSSPGCRRYMPSDKIDRVLNGMGVSIITTSKGVMSSKKAKKLNVGGEVLCNVW
ncbi:MAG: 30S ribosomal protein S8 [Candidatus Marinimicrobia bacterium]|jgi:small subunit ribosomal protein S8|nr:30S ribosomal protein S8 [Candidatus Neomarinimicrobiota bacterium]